MCGIFAVFGFLGDMEQFRPKAVRLSKRIRHRGPDWTGIKVIKNNVLCHERLAIVGVDSGAQPLENVDGTVILCVNGEIYNHKELRKKVEAKRRKEGKPAPVFRTGSDCEVILHLYEDYGPSLVNYLDGMFAFVLYDSTQDRYIATRDPIGIIPLYQGTSNDDGSKWFASELKSIFEDCSKNVVAFEPGTIYDSRTGTTERWYKPQWWDEVNFVPKSSGQLPEAVTADVMREKRGKIEIDKSTLRKLKESLERAVEKQLMSEVPYGVLLSGGLDSSLIASIAARQTAKAARKSLEEAEHAATDTANDVDSAFASTTNMVGSPTLASPGAPVNVWSSRLHSFSVGLPGSPDLLAARRVAKHIGTIHHEFTFTVEEGLDAVRDVIYHLETYDVTTIRASTPMYLLSRKIKATGVKMVLSGEGADEVFGGYLYFHQAPTPHDLHAETVKRVKLLHTSDCLRANKSTMAWGVEARVPFLDTKLLDMAMTMPPEYKHPRLTSRQMEKETLRAAFDVSEDDGFGHVKPFLTEDILWRQKEQFSDGVGYSWIDGLKAHAESMVEDEDWADRAERFPYNTPTTREAFFYRTIFEDYFCPTSLCTTAEDKLPVLKTVVKGCPEDPSGRAQTAHSEAYDKSTKRDRDGAKSASPAAKKVRQ